MIFRFPEAAAIRRLAASLSTSLTATTADTGALDLATSSRLYLRRLPWSGLTPQAPRFAPVDESTVGQFFAQFNYAGATRAQAEAVKIEADAPRSPGAVRRYQLMTPPPGGFAK